MPVSVEDFSAAVRRLAELKTEGLARLAIGPDGSTVLAIDPAAVDVPAAGAGLFADIFDALTAIGSDVPVEDFVRVRSGRQTALAEPEQEAVSRAKWEAATAAFEPSELRRHTLRATSKLPALVAFEWEVVRKEFDSRLPQGRPVENLPLAQLRIATRRLQQTLFPATDELVLGLDLEDIDNLIKDLEDLKEAFLRVTESADHPPPD